MLLSGVTYMDLCDIKIFKHTLVNTKNLSKLHSDELKKRKFFKKGNF